MIIAETYKLKSLLDSFLGESKNEVDESYQIQYPCPKCVAHKGVGEVSKYNLEVNLQKGVYNAWCCSQYDDEMHGSIFKLIKLFGNDNILKEYKDILRQIQQSKLYDISFNKEDFNVRNQNIECKEIELPNNFKLFKYDEKNNYKALEYLKKRNIGWDLIKKYNIGYTEYDTNQKNMSLRVIIPSFNQYGELNYWVGRDFSNWENKMKYMNPKIDKKEVIFNEEKICWDADITLVEGAFDHIVVPNSIPLLGKALKEDDKLFYTLRDKTNANINLWLDNDAMDDAKKIYKILNHGKLRDKIRIIKTTISKDPSDIYKDYGKKGIIECLKQTIKIPSNELLC